MQFIQNFLSLYWAHIVIVGVVAYAAKAVVDWMEAHGTGYITQELERVRTECDSTSIGSQLAIDDAVIKLLESYIPEVIHDMDETIKVEISSGHIALLDWKVLGTSLWAKARAEFEASAVDYMRTSGEKDGAVLAAIVAKKFFMRQSALQKGLIVPHN